MCTTGLRQLLGYVNYWVTFLLTDADLTVNKNVLSASLNKMLILTAHEVGAYTTVQLRQPCQWVTTLF